MARVATDTFSKICAFIAVGIGIIALLLACIGIGTVRWATSGNSVYVTTAANFFSYCTYDGTNGDLLACTSRSGNDHPACSAYGSTVTVTTSQSDCNNRLRNAAGLGILGILLLFFGILLTLIMAFGVLSVSFLNLIPGFLLFLACLFMLAAMAEGSRYANFNGYSANLYQAGHLFTMLSLFLSSAAGGRIAYACSASR